MALDIKELTLKTFSELQSALEEKKGKAFDTTDMVGLAMKTSMAVTEQVYSRVVELEEKLEELLKVDGRIKKLEVKLEDVGHRLGMN